MSDATTATCRVGRRLPILLRESATFRRYWGAHTISVFGDQISMLALPLVRRRRRLRTGRAAASGAASSSSAARRWCVPCSSRPRRSTSSTSCSCALRALRDALARYRSGCALFLAEFGSGLGVMLLDISAGTIFAAVIPPELRSRVSGASMFANYGIRVRGALAGGWLGASIGLRPTLWIATVAALGGVLWLLPSPVLRVRTLPELELSPEHTA